MKDIYVTCTGCSNITALNITAGYNQSSSVATITCDTSTLDLNDIVTVDAGYTDSHQQVFYGRVKDITRNREEGNITIVAKDILIDASDYFLVSDNPDEPFKRQNILAEDLIGDLLEQAGLTNYAPNVPLSFTYGVSVPAEFNLISIMDACNQIANILAWHVYADVTTIRFEDIRPYFRTDADKFTDYGLHLGDDVISHTLRTYVGLVSDPSGTKNIIKSIDRTYSDEGLRNRVVVYGRDTIKAKAQTSSPYLPVDFYKSAVIASPLIDSTEMAQAAANYNLSLYNRLTESCTLVLLGDASIKPRQFCDIYDEFTGCTGSTPNDRAWFIQSVSHNISAGGFETRLTCTR